MLLSYSYKGMLWDLYDEYTRDLKQPKKFIVEQTLKYVRKWDIQSLNRVDYFIANSNFVKIE